MKHLLIAALTLLLAAGMISCQEGQATYHSPEIALTCIAINSDTLEYDDVLDTLYVGDTLQLSALLNPYYNKLVSFEISVDRNYLKDSIFTKKDYEEFCDTEKSDPTKGYYKFKGMNTSEMMFIQKMQFIALQTRNPESERLPLEFILTSDLDVQDANPYRIIISLLIANKDQGSGNVSQE